MNPFTCSCICVGTKKACNDCLPARILTRLVHTPVSVSNATRYCHTIAFAARLTDLSVHHNIKRLKTSVL